MRVAALARLTALVALALPVARPSVAAELIHRFPLGAVAPLASAQGSATFVMKGHEVALAVRWEHVPGGVTTLAIRGPGAAGPVLYRLRPGRATVASDSARVRFTIRQSQKKLFRDQAAWLELRGPRHPLGALHGMIIPTDEENDEDD